MKVLTTEECKKLLLEFNVPEKIRKHSDSVNKLAMLLAQKLIKSGEKVDIDLLRASCLLHDLDKMITLKKTGEHGVISLKILSEKGYPEIGKIIFAHNLENFKQGIFKNWEEKLLCYSDLRTLESELVSIEKRFEYLNKRYPDLVEVYKNAKKIAYLLEEEIMKAANLEPEEIRL